jgi:tetratricopeptide (TPR) repeat protein
MEGLIAGNLSALYLFQGRWQELEALVAEWLDEAGDRPGTDFIHHTHAVLLAHRGRVEQAAAILPALAAWENSEDADLRSSWAAAAMVIAHHAGNSEDALNIGMRMLPDALAAVGPASDPVRLAWALAVRAGIDLRRVGEVRMLLDLLSNTPPGRIPPYVRAEVIRCRGLLASLEGRHDEVEAELTQAIESLAGLRYPYHLALAQLDLAEWLIGQSRAAEAAPLLEAALATFAALGAAPALGRAQKVAASASLEPAGPIGPSA